MIFTLSPASIYVGSMRIIKKRKAVCLAILLTVMVFMLMMTQSVMVDLSSSIRIASYNAQGSSDQLRTLEPPTTPQAKIQCTPVHNIAFIKTHKAGSSTIANILVRYGVTHQLNFALPNRQFHAHGYNYITRPGEVLTKDRVIPLPPGQEYNILFNHAVYNRTAFHMIMPANTTYFTILREPFQQFVSAFEYYGMASVFASYNQEILESPNPISTYLSNPYKFELGIHHFSYVKNKQAEDLGLSRTEHFSPSKLHEYIAQMDKDFRLVMIMEHFDESLLLLKYEFCWELKDILYIPQNANKHKPQRNFTEEDHRRHRRLDHLDYTLYSHYINIFLERLKSKSPDFFGELAHFKFVLNEVKHGCRNQTTFVVAETKWHKAFEITNKDCTWMMMPELSALDYLINRLDRSEKSNNGTDYPEYVY